MSIERGDVYLARFPHASGTRGKRRPVVVVQADVYNQRLRHVVVVQLTTNLSDRDEKPAAIVDHQPAGVFQSFAHDQPRRAEPTVHVHPDDAVARLGGRRGDEHLRL